MPARLAVPMLSLALATVLWLAMGKAAVVNYDTLYSLKWGTELAHGHLPDMTVPGAPTPHPLLTLAGVIAAPLFGSGSPAALSLLAYLGYLATSIAVVLLGLVAKRSFGIAAAIVASLLLVTREPVLSYGLRAYIDLPYLALLMAALAFELKKPRCGAPVQVALLLAGLLRPEAWLLGFAYLAWLATGNDFPGRRRQLLWLTLAVAAPVLWGITDLVLTGDFFFSFRGTRAGAERLNRPTGLGSLFTIAPRRIGEVLRWELLLGAAMGVALLVRGRHPKARVLIVATVAAALAFAIVAIGGLPVIVRYLLPFAAMGCVACAYALTGWRADESIPIGRAWFAGAVALLAAILALAPTQYHRLAGTQRALHVQQQTTVELEALVDEAACGPIIVPNRRAVPLVALWRKEDPRAVITSQDHPIPATGAYVYPASEAAANAFILDRTDVDKVIPGPPPGWTERDRTTRWVLAEHC
ncbi:MAG: hypothetical protein AAGC46_12425 [Solirubrobacteraceae bacterium]|nr:hypothetical protein [Patulibacter sp.]